MEYKEVIMLMTIEAKKADLQPFELLAKQRGIVFKYSYNLAKVPNIKKLRGTLKADDFSDIRDERERVL